MSPQTPASPTAAAIERLSFLTKTERYTNAFGVELVSHPDLGTIAFMEECAEWVADHGDAILAALKEQANG